MTRSDFYQSHIGGQHPHLAHADPTNVGIREAVGLFHSAEQLQDAIRDLEGSEFARQDLSVLGGRSEIENVFGTPAVDPEYVEDDSETPRMSPVRPEEKTIGATALVGGGMYIGVVAMALAAAPLTIPAALAAVAVGGGGGALIGGTILKLLENNFAQNIEEQLEKGGLLLWVRTADNDKEQLACDIMTRHGATHVKIHEVV